MSTWTRVVAGLFLLAVVGCDPALEAGVVVGPVTEPEYARLHVSMCGGGPSDPSMLKWDLKDQPSCHAKWACRVGKQDIAIHGMACGSELVVALRANPLIGDFERSRADICTSLDKLSRDACGGSGGACKRKWYTLPFHTGFEGDACPDQAGD